MRKLRIILLLVLSFWWNPASTQISHGGTPYSVLHNLPQVNELNQMPFVDVAALKREDLTFDQYKDIPYRFGKNLAVNFDLNNSGEWTALANGDRIWRLTIASEGALSLNFELGEFYLAPGTELFIYDKTRSNWLGSFNSSNNKPFRQLGTTILRGDQATFELYVPAAVRGESVLKVTRVTHAYRSPFSKRRDLGDSGNCNIDVVCSQGDPWRDQIRSVAIILVNGNGSCTGAMINNSCDDETPYFLTANHCTGGGNTNTWVYRFNWESPTCGVDQNGPRNQTISGSQVRARNANSDFALLELSSVPPASYNVYYAGWNRGTVAPTNSIAVHHPSGDVKKISFDDDPARAVNWQNAAVWEIGNWEQGTTEGGSSGSPLFDQNGRIIGQLFGGSASCFSNSEDNYGRFDVSWNSGGSASNQLVDWLDACNTGAIAIDGLNEAIPDFVLDAQASGLNGIEAISCETAVSPTMTFRNNGSTTITSLEIEYGVVGQQLNVFNWSGSVDFPGSETIQLPALTLVSGQYTYIAVVRNPNSSNGDENSLNDTSSVDFEIMAGDEVRVNLTTDNFSQETSIEIINDAGVLIYAEDQFTDATLFELDYCLSPGCYDFIIYDSFGDGICCGFFSGNGEYEVVLPDGQIAGSGAQFQQSDTISFCLSSAPVASFSASNNQICAEDEVLFTDLSSGSPTGLSWSFSGGDPATSTNASPVITYNTPGIYDVELSVSNAFGTDVLLESNLIEVLELPEVNFTVTDNSAAGVNDGEIAVLVSAGATPYTFNWANGETTDELNGLGSGNYALTVTDANGCSSAGFATVGNPVGLDLIDQLNLKLYPNPANEMVQIEFDADKISSLQLSMYNAIGELVKEAQLTNESNMIQLNDLTSGLYTIQLKHGTMLRYTKLIVN